MTAPKLALMIALFAAVCAVLIHTANVTIRDAIEDASTWDHPGVYYQQPDFYDI